MKGPSSSKALNEINVTPLVDVMLVLLIVFMITAPLLQQGLDLDLPKTSENSRAPMPEEVQIQIRKDQSIWMDQTRIQNENLPELIKKMLEQKPDLQVLIQAEQSLSYGYVASIISTLKGQGLHRIALATEVK